MITTKSQTPKARGARTPIRKGPRADLFPASDLLKGGRRIPIRTRKPAPTALYLSYGSNLAKDQMKWRCPAAVPVGKTEIPDTRLVFRGVADIEPAKGYSVPVGVWRITKECERALDAYEGYRPGRNGRDGLYRKEYLPIAFTMEDGTVVKDTAMVYVMNRDGYGPPSQGYLQTIVRGYGNFGLDKEALLDALDETLWKDDAA